MASAPPLSSDLRTVARVIDSSHRGTYGSPGPLGALGGALAAGLLADRYGRRPAILVAAGLFTIGAAVEAFAPGIFIAYAVDQALTNGDFWRVMLGVSAVPGVLLGIAMLPMKASPRWLFRKGREDDAVAAMVAIDPDIDVAAWTAETQAALAAESDQASWRELFGPRLRRPLMIGVGFAVFQQITGLNVIIYDADEIFGAAGFNTAQEQAAATTWAI